MFAAFLQKMKAAVFAQQPQDSREATASTCKTVTKQFHRNCETFSRPSTIKGALRMSYDVCEFILSFVISFQANSFP